MGELKSIESAHVQFKGLIMDMCVLLTSTPECVVSQRRAITRAQPELLFPSMASYSFSTNAVQSVDIDSRYIAVIYNTRIQTEQ